MYFCFYCNVKRQNISFALKQNVSFSTRASLSASSPLWSNSQLKKNAPIIRMEMHLAGICPADTLVHFFHPLKWNVVPYGNLKNKEEDERSQGCFRATLGACDLRAMQQAARGTRRASYASADFDDFRSPTFFSLSPRFLFPFLSTSRTKSCRTIPHRITLARRPFIVSLFNSYNSEWNRVDPERGVL